MPTLHPQLALISMIDHDDRLSRQTPGASEPARFAHAVGALFGEQVGPRAEIFMSYEMKVDIVENGHLKLDDKFLVEKLELRACVQRAARAVRAGGRPLATICLPSRLALPQ